MEIISSLLMGLGTGLLAGGTVAACAGNPDIKPKWWFWIIVGIIFCIGAVIFNNYLKV